MGSITIQTERLPWRLLRWHHWPARLLLCSLGRHDWHEYPEFEGKPNGAFCRRCWRERRPACGAR